MKIITVDAPENEVLHVIAENIQENEWPLAIEIADQLKGSLEPYFPAAGLAAPQIGISKAVFIYSFDRDPKNLKAVINPDFIPLGELVEGWEGCLSVILGHDVWKLAKLSRYDKIQAIYWDTEGNRVEEVLDGFAAKVFQHEYDHLKGIVNINRQDAIVKSFESKEALLQFMQEVKKEDSKHYKKPS